MKKNLFMLACAAFLLTACSEDMEVRNIKGGYHYKTSGQVLVSNSGKEAYPLSLTNETGMLEVVSLHNGDSLLLTFNQTGGGVYNTKGTTDGEHIRFEPFERTISLRSESTYSDTISTGLGIFAHDSIISVSVSQTDIYDLQVNGYAEVYDNTLLFYFNYEGKAQDGEKTIKGENIQMLAKKN